MPEFCSFYIAFHRLLFPMEQRELTEIIISWITISMAFAILMSRDFLNIFSLASAMPIAFFAVGTGFIFHELAHRNVAKHFGAHAEYRLWWFGLLFTIIIPIITFGSFFFAAPGAVYVFGDEKIGRKENGIISAAGPAANIIIAIILIVASGFFVQNELIFGILMTSAYINFYLAFFNLLPILILDGTKVFVWNSAVWGALFLISAAGSFFFDSIAKIVLGTLF